VSSPGHSEAGPARKPHNANMTDDHSVTEDEAEARRLTDRIRLELKVKAEHDDTIIALIKQARDTNVHEVLGYSSWPAYVAAEFGDIPLRLDREHRRELVTALSGEGMSTRAIAPVVGVDQKTVSNDLRASGEESSSPVQGLDGRRYTTKKQKLPVTPRTDTEQRGAEIEMAFRIATDQIRQAFALADEVRFNACATRAIVHASIIDFIDFWHDTLNEWNESVRVQVAVADQ
jgi:transposase